MATKVAMNSMAKSPTRPPRRVTNDSFGFGGGCDGARGFGISIISLTSRVISLIFSLWETETANENEKHWIDLR